jgi:hypothetical protein
MHTVKKAGNSPKAKWVVQFVESTSEPGYSPSRENLAWFEGFFDACEFASWLNGGPPPPQTLLKEAKYIE